MLRKFLCENWRVIKCVDRNMSKEMGNAVVREIKIFKLKMKIFGFIALLRGISVKDPLFSIFEFPFLNT